MPQARDEAGNIWETDAAGNAVRLVQAAQTQAARPMTFGTPDPMRPLEVQAKQAAMSNDAARLDLARRSEARQEQSQTIGALPTGYRWADAAHTKQEIIPGGPADTSGDTPAGLQTEAATVKALIDGRMAFPSGAALRNPYWQNMLAKVAAADPNFDAVNYNARAATRKDFTSGVSARNITAFNTALGHLGTLWEAGQALNNSGFKPWNSVANATQREFGDPRVDKFNAARQAAVDELEKAFRGSNGTQAGINEWKESINSAQSPEQLRAVIGQMVDLLGSRVNALGEQYKTGMGKSIDGIQLLDPHAQAVFGALAPGGSGIIGHGGGGAGGGGIPPTSGGNPSGGASPNQPGLTSGGEERTFYTERDQAVANEAQNAFISAIRQDKSPEAIRADVDAVAAKYGLPAFGPDLDKAIANRATNVGAQFAPTPTGHSDTGGISGAVASALPSGAGSFAAGVGNAAMLGQLGNIADAMGGSEGGSALGMRLARENTLPFFAGSLLGDTGMALATGGVLGKVAGKVASPGIAELLAKPITADATFGAMQGAGNSDGSLGGTVGGALLGMAGNKAGGYIGSKIAGARTPVGVDALSRGERAVTAAVQNDGPDAVAQALSRASELGAPANLADVSAGVNNLAGAAIRRSPAVAGQARESLMARGRGQYDRLQSAIARDLGPIGNVPQMSDDLIKEARTKAGPLYDQAYAAPPVGSDEIDSLLATPFGRQALSRAQTIAANERRNPMEMGFAVDGAGNPVLNPVPYDQFGRQAQAQAARDALRQRLAIAERKWSGGGAGEPVQPLKEALAMADDDLLAANGSLAAQPSADAIQVAPQYSTQTLDYVKRGMDDVLEEKRNPLTGKLVLDEVGRAQNSVLRGLLKEIDTYNPVYGEARSVYAGPASAKEALGLGQDAVNLPPNELGMQIQARPNDLPQMQLGFRSQLAENAGRLRYSSNPFESVLGNPAMEQRLATMYPENPEGVSNLIDHRNLEGQMAGSANRLVGNSMTAERGLADEAFAANPLVETALHAGAAMATHGASLPGTAARIAGSTLKDRIALGLGRRATQKAEQIAPLALNNDPAATLATLQAMQQRQAQYQLAKALLGEQGVRPGAIGGVSTVAALLSSMGQ